MSIPLVTTSVDVDRPVPSADYDAPATLTRLYTGLSGHVSAPFGTGVFAAGQQGVVDAVLLVNLTDPALAIGDVVTDSTTSRTYRVTVAEQRHGLGLDHQAVGLHRVTGGLA